MDFSLSDVLWVGGGLLAVTIVSLLFTRRTEIAQALGLDSLLTAGSAIVAAGSRTGSPVMVRADTNQAEPEPVRDFAGVLDYLKRHNLTDEELIAVYAVTHRSEDDYPLSANKICEVVGGTRQDVLATVASLRPKPPQPKPARRLERPAEGWGKAS